MREYRWIYEDTSPIEEGEYDDDIKVIIEKDIKIIPDKCEKLFNGKYLAYMLIVLKTGPFLPYSRQVNYEYNYFVLYLDMITLKKWRELRNYFPQEICSKIFDQPILRESLIRIRLYRKEIIHGYYYGT